MAVAKTPPSPVYQSAFTDAAQLALTRLGECCRREDAEPAQRDVADWLSPAWTEWHDDLHECRALLAAAVQVLLDHHDYQVAHHRQWGDTITVRSTARVAWAPVARRVLRDMATARTMSLAADG